MQTNQHLNSLKNTEKLSVPCRLIAGAVFLMIVAGFVFLWVCAKGYLDSAMILGICGFKQQFQLPCMGCGITTSSMAFISGDVLGAFYIQPAGAVLCCTAVVVAGFSLLVAVFGVDLGLLEKIKWGSIWKYLLVAVIVIFTGGWAVTLARALSNR
jgi:hypothetical protein